MEIELKSEGTCIYCKKVFSQKDIGKHLAEHLNKMQQENTAPNPETFCHIEVESNEMFLHLLVKGSAKMKEIDTYLKDIWLECCGHLSAFKHKNFKVTMSQLVADVFTPKIKIQHDYDFGSTTTVILKAHKHYQLAIKNNIILLSRNEPLNLICGICKQKPATVLCTVCQWNEYSFYCKSCAKTHASTCEDFDDYAEMPVVNSPRMGECGYTGGTIDLERDGAYKM